MLLDRLARAFGFLDPALTEISPRLIRTATAAQLRALIAVVEAEGFAEAARRTGLAQPTLHRAVAQLEAVAGRPLLERAPRRVTAARAVQRLAVAARLALAEVDQARAELAEAQGREVGRIVLGAMPLSRSCLLAPAIAQFRTSRPRLPLRVVEGPFRDLLAGLRRGEIDALIGALRPDESLPDLVQEPLLTDRIAVVARPGHPARDGAALAALAAFPWVVSPEGAPARLGFDALMAAHPPAALVESGSLILMRELLRATDHLAFVSALQVAPELASGALVRLPVALADPPRPIGLFLRGDWRPTPAQASMLDALRAAAAGLSDAPMYT
jgi:DNA-binding transcriptional LysR family regulator